MNLSHIKNMAFEHFGNLRSHSFKERGNKYYHGERTAALVLSLRKFIMPEDSSHDDILTVAAWFHDIKNGVENHAAEGAVMTRQLLASCCTAAELDEICGIIEVHDDRNNTHDTYSDFIRLHQDADHLDHFGSFDIWTNFIYAAAHDQTINDARDWLLFTRPTENTRYRSELNYQISREIFDEKMEFLQYFTERFDVECNGGIWNLDMIKR